MWEFLSENICIISFFGILIVPSIILWICEQIQRIREERFDKLRIKRLCEQTSYIDLCSLMDEVGTLREMRDQEEECSIAFWPPADPTCIDIEKWLALDRTAQRPKSHANRRRRPSWRRYRGPYY